MRFNSLVPSMVLSVACVSAANATVVYNTIDPFTTTTSPATVTNATSGYTYSTLSGTLWDNRAIKTLTSSSARATTAMTIGAGSMLFSVTRVGTANTATGTYQKALLDYDTLIGQYPDFTNFTSFDFNYVSDLAGDLKCTITFAGAGNAVEKTMSGASGLMSFTLADFGGIDLTNTGGPLNIEFNRSGSNASGSLTITNLVATGASIPAPGAVALLGAAGLMGARRRRA